MRMRSIATGATWILAGLLLLGAAAPHLEAQADRAIRRATREAMRKNQGRGGPGRGVLPGRKRPIDRRPGVDKRNRGPGRGPGLVERLMRMPAPQRGRFLQNNPRFQRLPARDRRRIHQRLQEFNRMNANQRSLMLERYDLFSRLPRHKQQQARGLYREWRVIPQPRRKELLDELKHLRHATPDARRERFAGEDFAEQYSESERQLLKDLTQLVPTRPKD